MNEIYNHSKVKAMINFKYTIYIWNGVSGDS
jgi:hypothetical protein